MSCLALNTGADFSCGTFQKKYAQQIVLINKKDVAAWSIQTSKDSLIPDIPTECRHRIQFYLKEGKTGYRFTFPERGSLVFGSHSKRDDNSRKEYLHRVQIAVYGVSEEIKCLLRRLDSGNYFASLQIGETIEIFGFEYGLTTNDYTYEPQGSGGSIIELISDSDALEDEAPFVYFSNGNEVDDFDNDFVDVPEFEMGDFNNDFNNDFFVELAS